MTGCRRLEGWSSVTVGIGFFAARSRRTSRLLDCDGPLQEGAIVWVARALLSLCRDPVPVVYSRLSERLRPLFLARLRIIPTPTALHRRAAEIRALDPDLRSSTCVAGGVDQLELWLNRVSAACSRFLAASRLIAPVGIYGVGACDEQRTRRSGSAGPGRTRAAMVTDGTKVAQVAIGLVVGPPRRSAARGGRVLKKKKFSQGRPDPRRSPRRRFLLVVT